jgi:hypothetical protein
MVFRPPLRNLVVSEGLYDDRELDWIICKVDRWRKRRTIKLPEPAEFDSFKAPRPKLDLAAKFGLTGIQVLVRLETVFLKPTKKAGAGRKPVIKSDWHSQGHMVRFSTYFHSAWSSTTLTPIERACLCSCRLLRKTNGSKDLRYYSKIY